MNSSNFPTIQKTATLAALALCLMLARPAQAQQDAVHAKTLAATGFVVVPKEDKQLGYGTCWVVDARRRLVVTNVHVVTHYDVCKIAFPKSQNGQTLTHSAKYAPQDFVSAKVLYRDAKRDLALLQLERLPAGALELAPDSIAAGSAVWGIGNSGMAGKHLNDGTLWRGRKGKVQKGFFWCLQLKGTTQKLETRVIQTDSGQAPGDSGGPVVDDQGRLVGVSSSSNDQGDYAIDVSEVRTFLSRCLHCKNLAPPARSHVGVWTLRWKLKDRDCYAALVLNADGTGHWDGAKICAGAYTLTDGRLTLTMPGCGVHSTSALRWQDNDTFTFNVQFSDGAIEFTASRR